MGQEMSQADLADASGLRQPTISRYLKGDRLPGLRQLDALERVLPKLRELRLQHSTLGTPVQISGAA